MHDSTGEQLAACETTFNLQTDTTEKDVPRLGNGTPDCQKGDDPHTKNAKTASALLKR